MYNQARIRFTELDMIELDKIALISHSHMDTVDQLREWGILQSEDQFYCNNKLCEEWTLADLGAEVAILKDLSDMQECISQLHQNGYTKIAAELHLERHSVARIIKLVRNTKNLLVSEQAIEEYDRTNEDRPPIRYYSPAVQADETLITHINGLNNVHQSQCWVIGVIDRGTQEFRMKAIGRNRSKQQFEQFFREYVSTNPRIRVQKTGVYTDGHQSYRGLPELGYTHFIVVHDRGFGEGINTTNQFESLWAQVKSYNLFNRGQRYSSLAEFQETLDEISWKLTSQRQQLRITDELAKIIRLQKQQN